MKKNDLNNKSRKLYEDLHKGVSDFGDYVNAALKSAKKLEDDIFAKMSEKEIENHHAFMRKHQDLIKTGKTKEAKELKEKYINE